MSNSKTQLDDYISGVQALSKEAPDVFNAFDGIIGAAFAHGALDEKTKHLIGIAICVCIRCKHCAAHHISEAMKAGASRREVVEAAMVAVVLGGSPAVAYAATTFKDMLDELGVV